MYSTTVQTPRQVILSAQAALDRIVHDSPLHMLSQGTLGDDVDSVLECTDATSATDALVYDERESYAIMRMYHPRYTADLERKQRSAIALELWVGLQKDVLYWAGLAYTYLSVLYKLASTEVRSYVAERRVRIEERLQQVALHIAQHQARVEARATDSSLANVDSVVNVDVPVTQYVAPVVNVVTPVVESIAEVLEPLTPERVTYTPSVERVAPARAIVPTTSSARTALVDLAPLLVYVRACKIVVSRIYNGYSPKHRMNENLRLSELTHQQYTDIIDSGTHSEISRRFPSVPYE